MRSASFEDKRYWSRTASLALAAESELTLLAGSLTRLLPPEPLCPREGDDREDADDAMDVFGLLLDRFSGTASDCEVLPSVSRSELQPCCSVSSPELRTKLPSERDCRLFLRFFPPTPSTDEATLANFLAILAMPSAVAEHCAINGCLLICCALARRAGSCATEQYSASEEAHTRRINATHHLQQLMQEIQSLCRQKGGLGILPR